ncbi:penicillin-binding transpeptidase domain-containing protein [Hungatella hathewayi]|uniref:penicillin-binding transpeptidase domain-containing protein n=1 Tax=Hungatella hathewayi TaxID=154046 RepID=UPI0035694EC9
MTIRRIRRIYRISGILSVLCLTSLSGCSGMKNFQESTTPYEMVEQEANGTEALGQTNRESIEENGLLSAPESTATESPIQESTVTAPSIIEPDWSHHFKGLNGAAVFYNPTECKTMIYNPELATIRRSPCSTFKIISSLIGLENGFIDPIDSVRSWSGESFWNEAWNKDIDFPEAFRTSCVWYFRKVIDDIGPDLLQTELNRLQYGNCDISDWEGRLNTNNNNRALTGFWIESSLKISASEQIRVMERIFGPDTVYHAETIQQLKQVMLVTDQDETGFPVYGKTGLGKMAGVAVDSWFTGFADTHNGIVYFSVYLGETEGAEVSSSRAKEIALQILSEF